ncbi:MAG: SEC-C domain-containing protein [Clostridiales bacterium]|nr:SEC-C domain-containing protein [Clostridiales bacterium]
MTDAQAKIVFDMYNPAGAVVRCPNGRAAVRKALDVYARAAVNLYGIISRQEFADIFNRQNAEQTTADEVFALLLPLALKDGWYCFFKDCIVHYWAIDDFDLADYWLRMQADKPRYLPDKDEFLKYADQYYEDGKQAKSWDKVLKFFMAAWPNNIGVYKCYLEAKDYIIDSASLNNLGRIFEKHGIVFLDKKMTQDFFDLTMAAKNNSRIKDNKGYTPVEMRKLLEAAHPNSAEPQFQIWEKVGLNDPCPCGSGKKYKKCCRLAEVAKSAQLSQSECVLFYETWYGLMGFINEKRKILKTAIKPVYPNPIGEELIYRVREELWENVGLIDEYLAATELPPEKISLLESWRDHHKKDMFFLLEYRPEHAVVLVPGEDGDDRLYGVKGISNSMAAIMKRRLPIQLETVLLPFKGKIIYDSYMRPFPIAFGEGIMKSLGEWRDKAMAHGIISSLE